MNVNTGSGETGEVPGWFTPNEHLYKVMPSTSTITIRASASSEPLTQCCRSPPAAVAKLVRSVHPEDPHAKSTAHRGTALLHSTEAGVPFAVSMPARVPGEPGQMAAGAAEGRDGLCVTEKSFIEFRRQRTFSA